MYMLRIEAATWVSSYLIRDKLIFFFNDTATTEIYTLSLHDALPISLFMTGLFPESVAKARRTRHPCRDAFIDFVQAGKERSEEHTSELQSRLHLVCRLLLEKKKSHQRLAAYVTSTVTTRPSTAHMYA